MEQFIITKQWLLDNRTARGGYTKAQADILLQTWPLKKGWQNKVIGNKIWVEMKNRFESLKTPNKKQVKAVMTIDSCIAYLFKNAHKMSHDDLVKLEGVERKYLEFF